MDGRTEEKRGRETSRRRLSAPRCYPLTAFTVSYWNRDFALAVLPSNRRLSAKILQIHITRTKRHNLTFTEKIGTSQGFCSLLIGRAYSIFHDDSSNGVWIAKKRIREHHFYTLIFHHRIQTFTPLTVFGDVLEKASHRVLILPSSTQEPDEKLDRNKSCDIKPVL